MTPEYAAAVFCIAFTPLAIGIAIMEVDRRRRSRADRDAFRSITSRERVASALNDVRWGQRPMTSRRVPSWVADENHEETAPARVRRSTTAPPRTATAAGWSSSTS